MVILSALVKDDEESDEIESVLGWLYTHWDCPSCDAANEIEADVSGEIVECPECGKKVKISQVC